MSDNINIAAQNGWTKWSEYVLKSIETIVEELKELKQEFFALKIEVAELRTEISTRNKGRARRENWIVGLASAIGTGIILKLLEQIFN